jgi:hypothetical protein
VSIVKAKASEPLDRRIDALVENGWFPSRGRVLQEAIRRFLKAHRPELWNRSSAWTSNGHCVAEADVGALAVCAAGPPIHLGRQS